MRNRRATSEGLTWEEDRAAVLEMAEAGDPSPGSIPLGATDADGWRYRATVREGGGRLAVASISIEAPVGAVGNLSGKLRTVRVPAILRAAAEWEAERRRPTPPDAETVAWIAEHAGEIAAEVEALGGERAAPNEVAAQVVRDLGHLPPSSFFPADAVERMDEREARAARKGRGDPKGETFFARIAIRYLLAARSSDRPNADVAGEFQRTGYEPTLSPGRVAKRVAGWVRYSGTHYGFLRFEGQGRAGAKPTPKLRRWAKANPDDEQARQFLQAFPTGKGKR